MVAVELKAYNDLDFACPFDGKIPANVAEQKIAKNKDEPEIDHVATHRGNLLLDNSTHFARHTKEGRIKK
jgi:hypothetical protein